MASFQNLVRRSVVPAAACVLYSETRSRLTSCDVASPAKHETVSTQTETSDSSHSKYAKPKLLDRKDEESEYFRGLFPKRQLWQPRVPYPLWDHDWDGRREKTSGDEDADRQLERKIRRMGVTRHIILIRHGQYDETHKEDHKRVLTPLGRKQADITGRRLAEMIKGADEQFGPCNVKVLRVSNMARAKETADIIAKHLPGIERAEPDPLLNEGRPAHHIPGGKVTASVIKNTDEGRARVEKAFCKYFFRAPFKDKEEEAGQSESDGTAVPNPQHEFEIIICHANVIRYFYCRALQLPPEAWLRQCTFNCSLTYLTIRPTGTVSCRMLGDIGHLPYDHTTFSRHHGFNW